MTNDELLKTCYAATHHAADLVSEIESRCDGDAQVMARELAPKLEELWRELMKANGAALELKNRAFGMLPPKQG